jgi:hypothetical protein
MRFAIAVVLVSACATNNPPQTNPDASPGGNPDAPSGTMPVAPKIGTWEYSQVTLVSNTCNNSINNGEAGNFGIDQSSLTSFHVIPNDGNPAFTCSLNNGAFDCPNRIAKTEDLRPSVDALITVRVDADGTFSDARHGTGRQTGTADCTGTDCGQFGTPCTFMQDFAIAAL